MESGLCIYKLFTDAKESGGLQFVFTLLRAEGITDNTPDRIRSFYFFLQKTKQQLKNRALDNPGDIFKKLIAEYDTYSLMANLIGNATGEAYKFYVLPHGQTDIGFASFISPVKGTQIETLLKKAESYKDKNPEFCKLLNDTFSDVVRRLYKEEEEFNLEVNLSHLQQFVDFLHDFLKKYYRILNNFSKGQKFYPFPNSFSVMEMLTNENGLYGIDIHHSNGSHSYFKRRDNGTDQMCYSFNENEEITIFMGSLDALKPMWMLNGKPFYEVGLPGRYNPIGEWRPIVYPGESNEIQKMVVEATKNEKDKRIAGCLFYIMATARHAIEFVVRSNFEIPYDFLNSGAGDFRMLLHKVKMPETSDKVNFNVQIYDGTVFLPNISVDTIGDALDVVGVFLNRIAFRVDGKAEWFLKYSMYESGAGKIRLSKKDFRLLGEYLVGLKSLDVAIIDSAMSWYTTAKNSTNIFTQYLNYYIAMESLAVSLIDGEMEAGKEFGIEGLSKEERKRKIEKCIKGLHEGVYQNDPAGFVRKAYSECILSLRNKTQSALIKVFGLDHEFVRSFSEKSEGKTLYDLRNDLAHGSFNHIDRAETNLIKSKLPVLAEIVYELIIRLSAGPDNKQRRFRRFSIGLTFDDPRSFLVVSTLNNLVRTDWKIQWEWLS